MNVEFGHHSPLNQARARRVSLIYDVLLIFVLLMGAWLRGTGIRNWDGGNTNHPDELFLVSTTTNIQPVSSLSNYFDTATSSLNPNNRGSGFYVYGTLPLILVRYTTEWIGQAGWEQIKFAGRLFSAFFDLATILLVYHLAARLYNRKVGILAAAFSALAVMQIQQSHFFTTDNFSNFFIYLSIYAAVQASFARPDTKFDIRAVPEKWKEGLLRAVEHPWFWPSILFGAALGMAMASKVSAAPAALLLPAAILISISRLSTPQREIQKKCAVVYLGLAALVTLMVFRILQPYAFTGPHFWNIQLNPNWLSNLRELRALSSRDVDFYPPAYQWARRPIWFSAQNLVSWGLGLPLGLTAWAGFFWAGWRMAKGEWRRHLLLWGWTGAYFTWQSSLTNPTMRYQLPVYPALAIFAAWLFVRLWEKRPNSYPGEKPTIRWNRVLAAAAGGGVLLATFAWAFAFTRIYTRPLTRVEASRWIYQNVPGPVNLRIRTAQGSYNQPLSFPYDQVIRPDSPHVSAFQAKASGALSEVYLPALIDPRMNSGEGSVSGLTVSAGDETAISISISDETGQLEAMASAIVDFTDNGKRDLLLELDRPVNIVAGRNYTLSLALQSQESAATLQGTPIANEGDWDWGLPFPVDGYDGYGGIYPLGLAFNMYDADSAEKLTRMERILDASEFIAISSNRQYGSLTRLPERFPLTTTYYRKLLGCPDDRSVEWCYNVARPGLFHGELGFELVKVFQSNPALGSWQVNDQFAEEAFTVYDHPKVLIFRKLEDYDPVQVAGILGAVDFAKIVSIPPLKAGSFPADLRLSPSRLATQRAGGTWSELFDPTAIQNRYPLVASGYWYLAVFLVGLFAFPFARLALPGLHDRGYPLARIIGMLTVSYAVWLAGSLGLPSNRVTISLLAALLAGLGFLLAFMQRRELRAEWRTCGKDFLVTEALFLAFFLLDLFVRLGNPDLWHPYFGGEKPMDFAYFNAVLKSASYPPYDPWFSGGYLNYYYFGFVFAGVLVKWLGSVPSIAYNLILPTIFAMLAVGAFSITRHIFAAWQVSGGTHTKVSLRPGKRQVSSSWVGLAGALSMAVLGNLGTLRMIVQGYEKLAAPGGVIEGANFLTRWVWAIQGFFLSLTGARLPYALQEWYWNPSRVMPAGDDAITEFPAFTVLYGDLHAHLFAMPIALLVLAWAVSVILNKGHWKNRPGAVAGFLLAGLAIGALYPTNLSDIYTYLPLAVMAISYTIWRYACASMPLTRLPDLPTNGRRQLLNLGAAVLLVGLSVGLFLPYRQWYGQAYRSVELWKGVRTPLDSFLTHWGLFLFVLIVWMIWETRDWMANTPLSALRRLEPYKGLIQGLAVLLLALVGVLLWMGVSIAWLVLPLAAWAGVLILRPGLPDVKRLVFFLTGAGLIITLMVELVVVRGDIGRMNTVFKFYLQVWILFSISSAAALGWLLTALPDWLPGNRRVFLLGLVFLVAGAALYPLMGGIAKVKDRMEPAAPHTLDGMAYMKYSHYDWQGDMDMSQDYRAIRWMQEHVDGSPVIVEAHLPEYRWGGRFSVYTGLPTVLGWNWHERQQRALTPEAWVWERADRIKQFYETTDLSQVRAFLDEYQVSYVILGQLEKNVYPGPGLDKFQAVEGLLWEEVYQDRETAIYKVLP